MTRRLAVAIALAVTCATSALAERSHIGYGRLLTNDQFGDGHDRNRTGAYTASHVWAPDWAGALPGRPGELLELRFHGETLAPDNMQTVTPRDRPYAGALSFGLHTHFARRGTEISLGGDLVMTGPQTRLDDLQATIHDLLGGAKPSDAVRANQIPDGIHPTMVAEFAHPLTFGETGRLRPFVEIRMGAETLLRAGADLTLGRFGKGALMIREVSSGQRYRVTGGGARGTSMVLGADFARVDDSVFLPESRGYEVTDRTRIRAGLHWQGRRSSVFYGVTWLDREFERQRDSQLVGSLRLKLAF